MRIAFPKFVHVFLALAVLTSGIPVQAGPQTLQLGEFLTILPNQAAPGAEIWISGAGFAPFTELDLVISGSGLPDGANLGLTTTDDAGSFHLLAALPDVPSGVYMVAINNPSLQPRNYMKVTPAPEILLSQPYGTPGTLINFTITNLITGTLRLDYDNQPIFGPVTVNAGSYSNTFIIPQDRPVILGDLVELTALNLTSGRLIGSAVTVFESQPIPADQVFTFSQVSLPAVQVGAGETFTVSGQISPPPADVSQFSLKMLWKTAGGQIFPITSEVPQIQPNGSFSVMGELPSLFFGSPASADLSAQLGLVLVKNGAGTVSPWPYTPFGSLKPLPKFIVKVVDQNNNPIPNAVVDIRAAFGAEAAGSGDASYNTAALNQQNNQVNLVLADLFGGSVNDPFNCPSSGTYGRTDANGLFSFEFDPEKIAMMGTSYLLEPTLNKYGQVPTEIVFPLNINGLYAGYGLNGQAEVFHLDVRYKDATHEFYNAASGQKLFTEPYVVTLKALPPGTPLEVPATPVMKGVQPLKVMQNFLGSGLPLYAFGNFLSFANSTLYPNSIFQGSNTYLQLSFQHDSLAYGQLDENNLTFSLDGVTYPFERANNYLPACGNNEYRANINAAHRLPPGAHIGLMQIKDLSGHTTSRYVQLTMVNPPAWFADTKLTNRHVAYNPSTLAQGQTSFGAEIVPKSSPNSISEANATLNKIGPVGNSASAYYLRSEVYYPSGQTTQYFNGSLNAVAINKGQSVQVQKPGPGATKITFGDTVELLNSGRIPMFRDVWGVPPIASATIGADMWFKASLEYNGAITFGGPAGSSYSLLVNPSGTVGADIFLDASALFGIVSAHASGIPEISMSIPATFENGQKLDSTRCFKYKLMVQWEATVGYCPLCKSTGGSKTIFKGHSPSDADPKYCSDPAAPVSSRSPQASPPPPDANPSLSSDGFGHTLAVWRSEAGQILYSQYDGLKWSTPQAISSNGSASSPQVAFYKPNEAIAVWSQNGLSPAAAGTANFDTLARNQHLVYSFWTGASWSVPKNLTNPGTGEGSLTLAACLSTTPGCPAGGAVTAAWVRDAAANLSLRQFRLFYTTYASGVWSAAQALDPASSATDSEPSLAYAADGTPWIAWVRDADRNLATQADHLLAMRRLAPGELVQIASSLPAGPSQPSLGVDSQGRLALAFTVSTEPQAFLSNKRQVYSAQAVCSPTCVWQHQALVDSHNRMIFGEGPALTLTPSGQAVITYRALGMGPLPNGELAALPEDAPGVVIGTGAIAQVFVDFSANIFTPKYLSSGQAPAWQMAAVYDSLTQQVLVTAAQGQTLPLLLGPSDPGIADAAQRILPTEPVVFSAGLAAADFALVSAAPSSFMPTPGDALTITLRLNNAGAMPGRIGSVATLAAAWDAPVGAGQAAGSLDVGGLDFSPALTITLPVTLPPDLSSQHNLYMTINPAQTIPEASFENNTFILTIGGLTIPQGLSGSAQPGKSLVILDWTDPTDTRVAGYRIYRQNGFGDVIAVGSAFSSAFADLTPRLGQTYWYMLTSYDIYGRESALSAPLKVELPANYLFLPNLANSLKR